MTRRDNLLERLEKVNPVPDPSRLYEDTETSRHFTLSDKQRRDKTMTDSEIHQLTPRPQDPRNRRGLLIGAAAAALVIIVGVVAFAFIADDGSNVAGSDSRVLQGTFDGEQCTYEGPTELSAGEVEFVTHNETSQSLWFFFARLDEGKTIEDLIEYNQDGTDVPSWTTNVWAQTRSPAGISSEPITRFVEPGLHSLTCGTWTPYQAYTGSTFTVTP